MGSLEQFDLLLGEALECMDKAAGEVREIIAVNQKDCLRRLGRAIAELWEIREAIYGIRPDLKRDFVQEYEQDKERYEKLHHKHKQADLAEKQGELELARRLYQELLDTSGFGFFHLVAEAGLYRVSKIEKT